MKNICKFSLALLLMSGCSFIPHYQRPNVDTPGAFTNSSTEPSAIALNWWTTFSSQELNSFMDLALQNNNDIKASLDRIDQAQALLKQAGSTLFPSLDASAGASRERDTRPHSTGTNLNAGLNASYELDLFGANRAGVTAAKANVLASKYDHEALRLVVMADVAQTYFNVLNERERVRIADDNIRNFTEVLRIVNARFEAGASDALDVSQQKSALASAQAARATIVQQEKNAEDALAVLLAKAPESLSVQAQNLTPLTVPAIAPGQPSSLLERRPDIREAEANLLAANANIGTARAAFFPSLNLGLGFGLLTSGFGDPAGTALNASAALLAPIFEGGALTGRLQQVTARQKELAEDYRKTVLVSFQDVEDSMAAVKASQEREASLSTAMLEARKSYELSRSQYDAGAVDFQTLLDAQRTLLQSEDAYAQSKNNRLAAAVSLFKALGGGWSESQEDTAGAPSMVTPVSTPVVAPTAPHVDDAYPPKT